MRSATRTLHGALLDAELLAEVYLAMTRGQESLVMDLEQPLRSETAADGAPATRARLPVLAPDEAEAALHAKVLQGIDAESKGKCLWLKQEGETPAD